MALCLTCRRQIKNCECQHLCQFCRANIQDCECCENCERNPCRCSLSQGPSLEETTSPAVLAISSAENPATVDEVEPRQVAPVQVQPAPVLQEAAVPAVRTMTTPSTLREPPVFPKQKDRKQLSLYISALKKWGKVGGVSKKDQAETLMYHAHNSCPEFFEELDTKFGETLDSNEAGLDKIIEYLEQKNGISQHSEIVRKLNIFYSSTRNKSENLVDFVTRFDQAYKDCQKIKVAGDVPIISYSATALSVLLLRSAALGDTDYQIISKGLNFDEKEKSEEAKVYDKTKAAMINHQVVKQANHQNVPGAAGGAGKLLATYLAGEDDGEAESLLEEFKTFVTTKKFQHKAKGPSKGAREKFWKCDYCICDCLKWVPCDCPCSSHKKEQCPNPDPEKKKLAEERDNKRKSFKRKSDQPQTTQAGTSKRLPTMLVKESTSSAPDVSLFNYMDAMTENCLMVKPVLTETEDANIAKPVREALQYLQEYESSHGTDGCMVEEAGSDLDNVLLDQNYGAMALQGSSRTRAQVSQKQLTLPPSPEILKFHVESAVYLTDGDLPNEPDSRQFSMIVDTASPSTIIGKDNFVKLRNSYPPVLSRSFEYQETTKKYEFGGGEKTHSLIRAKLPLYVLNQKDEAILVNIWVEVVDQEGVPFLLGGVSLDRARAVMKMGSSPSITFNWQETETLETFPLYKTTSGHYHLLVMTLSKDDERSATINVINNIDWTDIEKRQVINLTIESSSRYNVADAFNKKGDELKVFLNKQKVVNKSDPLSEKEVVKLHHFWGHLHPDKLEKIIKASGKFNAKTLEYIKKLEDCEVCQVEARRAPKPKSTAPKSISFNHLICIDLKENIRYKNSPPYILYIVDSFTKFKAAKFLPNKRGETVTEAILLEWVKYFGPPQYIQSDRGKEFLNQYLQSFCSVHNIRMTTTASFTPNANGLVERNHAVIDKMLEKMVTADETMSPQVALCWSIQASNCLDLVDGISPHMLVFGRVPQHPSMTDLGDVDQVADVSERLYQQYKAMLSAREVYTSLENQGAIRKALKARVYTDHTDIKVGEWIYYKTNVSRYWQGPVKVLQKQGKRLYSLKHGSPVVINTDDVLLHKPGCELGQGQPLTTVALREPVTSDNHTQPESEVSVPIQSRNESPDIPVNTEQTHQDIPDIQEVQQWEEENRENHQQTPRPVSQGPATSTNRSALIGHPMLCKHCSMEVSSKLIQDHAKNAHNITGKSSRSLATLQDIQPDSLYANADKLQQGDVLVSQEGKLLVLQDEKSDTSWTAVDLSTKKIQELDLVSDMTTMRFVGQLDSESEDGINVSTDDAPETTYFAKTDFIKKIFIAAESEYNTELAYVVTIPRSRHGEDRCIQAKNKELQDFIDFDVYDIVDEPDSENIIGTEWVLVEKDAPGGGKRVKARLCCRGDLEANKHLIPVSSPTANKISIKILLTVAASQGKDVRMNDVQRAFLQTEELTREVFVRPPVEAGLPAGKVWALKRACYGLIDASRAYFLKHANDLKALGFQPLKFDPATFVRKMKDSDDLEVAYAAHVDDCITIGEPRVLDEVHREMEKRLKYGEVQKLPGRHLGINIRRDENGDFLLDQDHYIRELEIPNMDSLRGVNKADILSPGWQTTFRSLASKLNMIALSSRPDFTYGAKFLTTRYGKATKSDLTRAVRMMRKAQEEPSVMKIPSLGDIKDWIMVGVTDASNKSASEIFSVGGHVILLINKHTAAASVVHWSSKKIERVVSSSLAAETLALQKASGSLFLVRKLLEGICGDKAVSIPCIVLTDSQNLWSCVHNLTACNDNRLQADVINIREAIHEDQTIQEVRYIHRDQMIADCLTKQTNLTGEKLLAVVRTGIYDIPGGATLRDSTQVSVKTWSQLVSAEQDHQKEKVSLPQAQQVRDHEIQQNIKTRHSRPKSKNVKFSSTKVQQNRGHLQESATGDNANF